MPALFTAGQKPTAAALNAAITGYREARSSADETVTTTVTDVNSATLTFSTVAANTVVNIESFWDVGATGGTDTFIGTLYVDGVVQATGECHAEGGGTSERLTVTQGWTVTLVAAGSHTLKLRRQKSGSTDTLTLFGTHSKIIIAGPGL